jgi:spore coat polysaccharide biosynthesis protein SpsF
MNIVAIIQARIGSTRLPGKVLKDIEGKPMLVRVVERVSQAHAINDIIIATTSNAEDDEIESLCNEWDYKCYRGSENDVLDRYYQAANQLDANIIVRITSDCPLIDPEIIDSVIEAIFIEDTANNFSPQSEYNNAIYDFVSNRLPPPWHRTYPIGLDVEVVTYRALEQAWKEAKEPFQREHVMPYLYTNENKFKIRILDCKKDYGDKRWTVDEERDLEFVRTVYACFTDTEQFGCQDIINLLDQKPELSSINSNVVHKNVYDI